MNQTRLLLIGIIFLGTLLLGTGLYLAFKQDESSVVQNTASNPVTTADKTNTASSKSNKVSKNITVPANKMWYDTGIDIPNGSNVEIRYLAGKWSNTSGTGNIWTDGNGSGSWNGLVVPNAPLRSLIAKTDSGKHSIGNNFQGNLGNGRLYLGMNDVVNTHNDNMGELEVSVEVK